MRRAAFAIPGDIYRRTGGFIYELELLLALRDAGHDVAHVDLPARFPDPDAADMAKALKALTAIPADVPVIIDGLVFGAIDPAGLDLVNAPIVAMIHHPLGLETGLPPDRAAFLMRNEAQALRRAAHVVVPSPHTAHILVDQFAVRPDKITIAPPGIGGPPQIRQPQTPPLILSVGLLAARKGHDVLLDALARLTDIPWQARIVGGAHDAEVAQALKAQAAGLGIAQRVEFTGLLDDDAVKTCYGVASIFALATRYEGYGMVFGEAMLWGLPVVSCNTGAVPDTVGDAGILVAVDDVNAFSNALRDVLTDDAKRRMLETASARAGRTLPVWSNTARIMAQVLDRARL